MNKAIIRITNIFDKFCYGLLIISLIGMLGFSVFGIILRWFNQSFIWLDPLVRHLVLLGAFLGGVLAIPTEKHIAIDVLGIVLKNSKKVHLKKTINLTILFSGAVVSFWLLQSSYLFFLSEKTYGSEVFWGLHSSTLVAIIPFGFLLIGLRFLLFFLDKLTGYKEWKV